MFFFSQNYIFHKDKFFKCFRKYLRNSHEISIQKIAKTYETNDVECHVTLMTHVIQVNHTKSFSIYFEYSINSKGVYGILILLFYFQYKYKFCITCDRYN